jgi:hypothetical protein
MQLAGELSKISLPSLIQLSRNGELTGKLCLTHGVDTAFIFVEQGKIIHAETDGATGAEALIDLFVWTTGTFSFIEQEVQQAPRSLADEPIEKIVREGLAYGEHKKFLDQMRISSRTILRAIASASHVANDALLSRLDGLTPLGQIVPSLNLPKRVYTASLHKILASGLAVVVEQPATLTDKIDLPGWVVSRLKQDNPDLSQAIVEMVIWVDRIKCWMYQADADLERLVSQLKTTEATANGSLSGASAANESAASESAASESAASESAASEL